MGRYTGPRCRLCRREGKRLYLKGARCYTSKCALERRNYPPGMHGQRRAGKPSEYGIQLRAKQQMRRIYGVSERQFRNYFRRAVRQKGITGEILLQLLERRLDNVVYRLGFASSRAEARQLVSHRHIMVNGRIVNIPSYLVREGDVISVKPRSRGIQPIQNAINAAMGRPQVPWLEVDYDQLTGRVLSLPTRDQIDTQVDERLVVEFYSR